MALTAIQVKEAKSHSKDLKISDGEGMYLLVKVNASKYYLIFSFPIHVLSSLIWHFVQASKSLTNIDIDSYAL